MDIQNIHKYVHDTFTVYNYNGRYKVVFNNVKRSSGYEETEINQTIETEIYQTTETEINQSIEDDCEIKRFPESLSRSKKLIFGYAMCNDWEYFCTFTLDEKKKNRFDLNSFYKDFSVFINNYNRKLDNKLRYLLVPEQHKNGAWHMHGLFSGIPSSDILQFSVDMNIPTYIKNKVKSGAFIGSWIPYANKFGFNDIELVNDSARVSSYIIKYITKDMLDTHIYNCRHLFYASKGLKSPIKLDVLPLPDRTIDYGFENDYCKIKWYDNLDSLLEDFIVI